jgi:hypothetical protein
MLPKHKMPTPPTLADLESQYTAKLAAYTSKVSAALRTDDASKLPEIRALNVEITALLEQMLTQTNQVADPSELQRKREALVSTLAKIQREYSGLSSATDSLERLRRIRESGTPRKEFELYLAMFFVTCLGILGMVFFGAQNTLTAATSASIPPRAAAFV